MKKALLLILFLSLISLEAANISSMVLRGGTGTTFSNWSWNGQGWNTYADSWWVLGVSSQANGPLINQANKTIPSSPMGTYWLYSEPTSLGTNARLVVNLSDGTVLDSIFTLAGTSGTQNVWNRTDGSNLITLGWAQGTANLVGSGATLSPSGGNDCYLQVTVGAVPEPASILLFILALISLSIFRRNV